MSEAQRTNSKDSNNLLHAKLMPPRLQHSAVVQRGALLTRLDTSLTKKLTVVAAPTGFGKTTLVSMWIATRKFKSAWVTLDENDNDPARFWTYVVSALRTFDSAVGKSTLSALMAPQPPSFQTLLSPLVNDFERLKEPCVLMLDEYHTITSAVINDGLSFLIQHLPESLHLIIISRNESLLSLGILRARGEMMDITAADLRFDESETQAFLRATISTQLPSAVIVRLQERTEGWAAGLRLAALSMQNKNVEEIEKFIETFSGNHRYVSEYLTQEVFENQPTSVQNFLLKTCFLNRLTASLCDEITDTKESAAMLEHLERDNLFIVQLERGGDQAWYRYNSMFAESIQYLAKQRLSEADIASLFEKASRWYEYHGLYDEAIESALAAKLFDRVSTLIEKFIEIRDLSEMGTLRRWLENIPQKEILLRPVICFAYAQVILYSTDRFASATASRIEPFLRAAEEIWRAEENHQRLGQLLTFRGTVAWWQGDFQKAFEFGRKALNELPEYDVLWRGSALLIVSYETLNAGLILEAQDQILEARALLGAAQNVYGVLAANQMLAEIFYWQGELEQAEQLNQQILIDAVGDESMLDDQGVAALNLAHIAYERNDLERAEQYAARALDLGKQRANEMLQVQATIRLAYIESAKNELSRGHELLKSLEAKIQNPTLLCDVQNMQALLSIRANDASSLEWWIKIISAENHDALRLQKERETFILARLRIAEGKSDEALETLNGWWADAAANGRVRSQLESLCLEALAHPLNSSKANEKLIEALTLGQALGFRRMFLDEGAPMAARIQAILPSLPNRTLRLFATTLLHSFSPEATAHLTANRSTVQIEALSQQELRVLRLLVAGLSNADIAQELVVSTNTIKTQVKSIYRKLNIKSRNEAREVERELKLLS
jgi:LuxR family transcriptional regulator, maltose regulon positive regulatory protein